MEDFSCSFGKFEEKHGSGKKSDYAGEKLRPSYGKIRTTS
jgi:hypothetical protein